MAATKPQPNYVPFFGPYNRDPIFRGDQLQFLTWPPKQRKSDLLARLLQGPLSPLATPSEDLSGVFVQAAAKDARPFTPTTTSNDNARATGESKSYVKKAWEAANTPIADLAGGGEGTMRKFLVGDVDRMMAAAQRELDQRAARGEQITYWDALKSVGGLGMGTDAADLVGSFTSPVGLATSFLGVLGRGAQAAKSLSAGARQANLFGRAVNLIERTAPAVNRTLETAAPALNRSQQLVGTSLGILSAYGLATGRPLDTLKSTAKVVTGGQSEVSPDEARQDLANASGLAGAMGSAIHPLDFARVRLQDLPAELPARQRISYTNYRGASIPFEEANRLRDTPEFRSAIADAEQRARHYGQRVTESKTSVGRWGGIEPSATTEIWGKGKGGDPLAADIGKANRQDAVLRFREAFYGPDAEYTLVGLKDPLAALDLFQKHGLPGGRVENGAVAFIGRKETYGSSIGAAADELGVPIRKTSGYVKTITAPEYDATLREHQQQRNLVAKDPAFNLAVLAAGATSLAKRKSLRTQ